MGKASSSKKVQRAAKAGGGRARAAGERNLLFPAAMVLVVVLGVALVVYARDTRQAEALESPLVGDHWHSSYGFYVCDEFLSDLPEFLAPQNGGNHTHGDGLIHVHPFATSRAGENATLANWIDDAGEALGTDGGISNDRLQVPLDDTYAEGESDCDGLDGEPIVQVAIWSSARDALDGEDPDDIVTEGFGDIRFLDDGQAFTIAFAPEGAELPAPPSTSRLADVGSDLGVPDDLVPDDVDLPGADAPDPDDPESDGPDPDVETSETTDDAGVTDDTADATDETTPTDDE